MTISVAIAGASGRLGSVVADVVRESPGMRLHAAMTSASDPAQMRGADVLVDATRLDVSEGLVDVALTEGMNVVIGTSGWDQARVDALRERLPRERGVLVVPNFSLGSVTGTLLAGIAARFLADAEIIEAHHAGKIDSPSGTAIRTAERIAEARRERAAREELPGGEPPARELPGVGQPARGAVVEGVPVHSLRLPGVVAEQRVLFGGAGELLEIRHETLSPDAYRAGIRAAILAAPEMRGVVVGLGSLLGLEHS